MEVVTLSAGIHDRRHAPSGDVPPRRRRDGECRRCSPASVAGASACSSRCPRSSWSESSSSLPIVQAVYYSFTQWDGLTDRGSVRTWSQAFHNPNLWRALENNALLLIAGALRARASPCIAVLLHQRVAGWRMFRSIYFLPTAISWVVIGLVAERFFAYSRHAEFIITTSASRTLTRTCSVTSRRR